MTETREEYRTTDFDPRSVAITHVLDDVEQTIGALNERIAELGRPLSEQRTFTCATCRLGQEYCPIRFALWQKGLLASHDKSFGCNRWEAMQ